MNCWKNTAQPSTLVAKKGKAAGFGLRYEMNYCNSKKEVYSGSAMGNEFSANAFHKLFKENGAEIVC
jgi:hypothetical protein